MKPNTIPIPAIVLIAVACFIVAGLGDAIDIKNGYWFGSTYISEEAGQMFALASGAGLILLPLAMLIPSLPARWLGGAYIALMAFAGFCNYSANIAHGAETANGSINHHKQYIDATKKRDNANATIANIKEGGKVKQLAAQVDDAAKTLADASKSIETAEKALAVCETYPYGKLCKDAKAAKAAATGAKADAQSKLDALRERLSDAEARDEAKATLAEAEKIVANGDVVVPEQDGKMAILLALVTLGMTGFAKIGASAIAYALASQKPTAKAKPRKTNGGGDNGGGARESGNVVNMHRWAAQKMLDDATESGSGIRGSAFLKAYQRTAKQKITAAELRAVLEAILPEGSIADRNSGWVIKGLRLKTATERKQARKAATC